MNVAVATSTVSRPFAFMTPRGSDAVDSGAGTRTPASSTLPQAEADTTGGTDPLVNRFPTIAFSYDTDASRLVMLYRDPANGKTVSQIPTEAALKQYKEAQQKEKEAERASLLKLTVGDSGHAGGQAANYGSAAYGRGGSEGAATAGTATASTPRTAAPVTATASAAAAFVAHSASVATSSAGTSAGRVNVVI